MTGQPSDLAGEPAVDRRKDLEQRLQALEKSTKADIAKVFIPTQYPTTCALEFLAYFRVSRFTKQNFGLFVSDFSMF